MGFRSPIYCGRQKVRVIEPNGQLRRFKFPITVPDLLRPYPHHYLRHVSGSILADDAELEGGDTYMLLPLPRLFPYSPEGLKRQRDSNPRRQQEQRPCEGYNRKRKTWRRRKFWEPSLDIISENAMLLQTKTEEENVEKRQIQKPIDMKYRAETCAFKKEPWYMQNRLKVSTGFIF